MTEAWWLGRLLEEGPGAHVVVSPSGMVVRWNQSAQDIFGYSSHEAVGQCLDALIAPPVGFADDAEAWAATGPQGDMLGHEVVRQRKDGALIYVTVARRPMALPDDDGVGCAMAITEVTRFKMRRDTRLIDARFGVLLESTPDAIVMVNQTGRVVLFNGQAESMFGYSREDVLGEQIEMLLPERFRGSHAGHRGSYFAQSRTRPMGLGLALSGRRLSGEEFPVEISLSPIHTEVGPLVMSAIRDTTERRRVEQALHEKNIELERANLAKDRFLATMSHELRTPLNAIIGFTGLLLMHLPGPLTAEQEAQLGMVQSSAKYLLSLINDLLDLAKIESGKVEVQLVPVLLQPVLDEVATTLRPAAQAKGLHFALKMPDAPCSVRTDRRSLQQILLNLCSNAVKFTEQGSITLAMSVESAGALRRVRISVTDTGAGLSPEDVSVLFRAFSRVDAARRPKAEGTGLGLYLCKKLAELLGGAIEVESQRGRGSCFTLVIDERVGDEQP